MTKLTALQYAMMDRIAHDEMNPTNGATPTRCSDVGCYLWVDEFAADLGITGKQAGGVLTSLETAGMIVMHKVKKVRGQADESTVDFTKAGFAAWQTMHIEANAPKGPRDRAMFPAVESPYRDNTASAHAWALLVYNPGKSFKELVAMGARANTLADAIRRGFVTFK